MQRELHNSNRIQEGFQEHPSGRLHTANPSKSLAALEGISFRYDPKEDLVLEDFSLSIEEGEIFCLLGESGCGENYLPTASGRLPLSGKGKDFDRGRGL